ncbi:MAG: TIGR00159 family protein [Ruminococcaceae bacterium]|nr:TIGR00159 family protein [Oscillospiraceae bacterium]
MQITGYSDIMTDLGQFLRSLFQDFTSGLLFFGGPLDIIIAVGDILATSLVVYYVLKLLRDSRAWQLLKGLILILAFAVVCSLAGLNTVGFLLNNTISVLAIAFVVIFQPELRRALETVGRSSFNVLSSAIAPEEKSKTSGSIHNTIEAIVRACEKMAETRTGALIIIERQTRLGDLAGQENVVQLDAAVSATMLLQIFYKGSPLHDGAVLVREGRLAAARVHVPLSDNYHLRRDYGTRHRAAVGASEMGDAIAVVVSEERGSISLALEGRLYMLDNGDALRTLLHKLLGVTRSPGSFVGSIFRSGRRQKAREPDGTAMADDTPEQPDLSLPEEETAGKPQKAPKRKPFFRKQRILLIASSLAIAIVLWLYVQVTINPIETRTFTVPLNYTGITDAEERGFEVQYPLQSVQVTLMGRRKTITALNSSEVNAYIDFAQVESSGLVRLEVQIDTGSLMHLRTTYKSPANVTVSVRDKQ